MPATKDAVMGYDRYIYIQNKNTCIHSDSDISVTLASWLGKNDVVKPEGWQYQ